MFYEYRTIGKKIVGYWENLDMEEEELWGYYFEDYEIGQGILNEAKSGDTTAKPVAKTKKGNQVRWASRVAEAFAKEKDITLDDFPSLEKITKQNILDLLKTRIPEPKPTPKSTASTPKSTASTS